MLLLISRYQQSIAWFFVALFYAELVLVPLNSKASTTFVKTPTIVSNDKSELWNTEKARESAGYIHHPATKYSTAEKTDRPDIGPDQPEMQGFSSVNNSNMVDLFTGDFAYNIPLLDVGGYPVNLSYRSGISMDQEASWVGLGWSLNPGTVNRNLRGLPDDFNGASDSIKKTLNIRENKTIGVTAGAGGEIGGMPINLTATAGVFHNNYKGWGIEYGVNASLNAGAGALGSSTQSLSITNNTQEGFTISPAFSLKTLQLEADANNSFGGVVSGSLPYNSRSGLKGLQLTTGIRQYNNQYHDNVSTQTTSGIDFSSFISFASPAYTPSISIPFTSRQFSFTGKIGGLKKIFVENISLNGYVSSQKINQEDTSLSLPAYGYLNYQAAQGNSSALLDFNMEKDLPYREKPPVPHIAIPGYTYDAFSITGEGTGGMFRAYRGDIGFVYDHSMRTKDASDRASIDAAFGDLTHAGIDLNVNRAYSQNGPWLENNTIRNIIGFKRDTADFQASYFRNPSEKSINSKSFYDGLGGDDVVAVNLFQPNSSSSLIQATNYLRRYKNKRFVENKLLTANNGYKNQRDKRTQVITYLNAKEAEVAGLAKYIESYNPNVFGLMSCGLEMPTEGAGTGLPGDYYNDIKFTSKKQSMVNETINYPKGVYIPINSEVSHGYNQFSVRWTGRIKAPENGRYKFQIINDDGVRMWVNDSLVFNRWNDHAKRLTDTFSLNLLENEFYTIKLEYYQNQKDADIVLSWRLPSQSGSSTYEVIPKENLYSPAIDTFAIGNLLVREKRLNEYRKSNHISEVSVLNNDGRRYVYGIPVYNLKQKESTFAIDPNRARSSTGLVAYNAQDNSTQNNKGRDNYYSAEEIPAYAHSFLLTGILSADYVDVSGNGITDDDLGDAVKFNYSKISGVKNPFKWRIPYVKDSANYNEGFKTDNRDDKASVVYGEKELWYLHSIESKTMIATFVTESRSDLLTINESGLKQDDGSAKRLKEINLYSKADFAKKGVLAAPIKTVHFEYSYELCKGVNKDISTDSGKLTLRKVWFTYNNNNKGKQNPYTFYYNNNPNYRSKSYDRWGNYKRAEDNPSNSTAVLNNDEYPYALQDSSKAALNAWAWSLDSIALPSGGSIKAEFESDDYAFVQNKRAMNLIKPLGFASSPSLTSGFRNWLYDAAADNRYVYFQLSENVDDKNDFYKKYLDGITKVYFKLFVEMPADIYGQGSEYVTGYADIDPENGYGISNNNIGWIKLSGISLKGDGEGDYSPLAKTSIQFLRLNLPSKAYPYSEPGDNISPTDAVKMLLNSFGEITNAFSSFDRIARDKLWARMVDLNKSFFRLNKSNYKKLGGGHRVKRIKIYDNWNKMAQRRSTVYGQEYSYTTDKEINGATKTISSGVASYEPAIGGEENPFRMAIEYVDKAAVLGPVTLGYSEEPLGESFFPSAAVGYSKVRVRTINYKNTFSANGLEETQFYTTYDFPTYTDRTLLDIETKKRFKPSLANFLRINARHHMVLSQGFKIELNDMNGKLRSQASYSEKDLKNPILYTENIYKTENNAQEHKRLSNIVTTIDPAGNIDTTALIGKDVELMVAFREQKSVSSGANINANVDVFTIPFIPAVFVYVSVIPLYQREETLFRTASTFKVIQRYGILDKIIHVDKGSKIVTRDLAYDSETGDVLLNETQNEFNDPVYNFSYPSHWAYDAMGLAYKNVDVTFKNVKIKQGRIISGISNPTNYFSSGDEILVGGKLQTDQSSACDVEFSTFPSYTRIWAINKNVLSGGTPAIYFIDRNGKPYNGDDVSLKITRSGRKNILSSVGAITSLKNPLIYGSGSELELNPDSFTKVVNASAAEFKQLWRVDDRKMPLYDSNGIADQCPEGYNYSSALGTCIKDTAAIIDSTFTVCATTSADKAYSSCGSFIYNSFTADNSSYSRSRIDISNPFWVNIGNICNQCNYDPQELHNSNGLRMMMRRVDSLGTDTSGIQMNLLLDGDEDCAAGPLTGPLNRSGIWACSPVEGDDYYGFTVPITIPHDGTYYIGMGADNLIRVTIDGVLFKQDVNPTDNENFKIWHIYPRYFTAGRHTLKIEAFNGEDVRVVGCEIYDNTASELRSATSYSGLNLIFSTKDISGQTFPASYSCPSGYALDQNESSQFVCRSYFTPTVTPIQTIGCFSTITDTAVNPYTTGALGNWRVSRQYVYYSRRAQSDPAVSTNIRDNGEFESFNPFWKLVGNELQPQYDSTKWVWNSEKTLFNKKGYELENKDPLGRYNAGLYGYNLTMPIAVVQNSRYRESGFDGFEDYDFNTQVCDTTCAGNRQFDFTSFKELLDTTQRHSGKYSLRLNESNTQAGLTFTLSNLADDTVSPELDFAETSACSSTTLDKIELTAGILLPSFSPLKGQRMLISAWVKEDADCMSNKYENNGIVITSGSFSAEFKPSGNIVEGWQRYESVFDIPGGASQLNVALLAKNGATVYFDDVRIHPYNANMKSFVFNATNLRLMAELDENNYATFYEYDDDGTLIRLKKETERGIKTIKETRSALLKE